MMSKLIVLTVCLLSVAAAQSPPLGDTVARNTPTIRPASQRATPDEMVAKCREMYVVLLECGQSNDTIAALLREVGCEEQAVRGILPPATALCLLGYLGSVLLGGLGAAAGSCAVALTATSSTDMGMAGGCMVGGGLGGAVGSTLGAALGANARRRSIVDHRKRVSTLVLRVNRAVTSEP